MRRLLNVGGGEISDSQSSSSYEDDDTYEGEGEVIAVTDTGFDRGHISKTPFILPPSVMP